MKKTMGFKLGACVWMALVVIQPVRAADILSRNIVGTWDDGATWNGGVPPGTGDVGVFQALGNTSLANALGSNQSWQGIRFSATIARELRLNKSGTETLTLGTAGIVQEQASDSTRKLHIIYVDINLGAAQVWDIHQGSNNDQQLRIDGNISGAAGNSLAKSGGGTLTLNGANTFTGGLTLNSGILILGNNAALGGAGNVLTINGGTINVTGARTTTNNNAQNWDGDFTFAGASTWNTGTGAVTLGGNRIVTVSASTLTVGGAIDDGVNTYSLTKAGAGTLTLTGNNTYSGGTTVSGGTLDITGNANALGTGTLTLGDGTTVNANNSSVVEYANNIVINGNVSLTGLRTTYNGTVDLGSATRTLTVVNAANNGNVALRLQGVISGNGGITKDGTGGLRLGNTANTFTGDVTVNAGMLELRSGGSLGNAANKLIINGDGTVRITNVGAQALTMSNNIEVNANFDLAAGNTITLNGAMDLGGGTRTITLYGTSAKVINGNISNGGLALAYGNNGTLTLGGNNTYAGTTTVAQDCTLQINGSHAGNGAINVQTGGTLQINGTHTGSGLITVASGAKLEGTGAAGDTRIQSGGILAPGNSVGELTLGNLTLDGGATMEWEFDGVGGVDELNLDGLWQGTGTGWSFDFLGTGPASVGSYTIVRFAPNQTNFQTGDFTVSNLTLAPEQSGSIVVNKSEGEILLAVIPEPASLGTLGMLALAGILRRRLRR